MSLIRKTITLLVAVLAFTLVTVPSNAAASSVQDEIDEILAEYGGVQTAWNEVSWDGGEVTLSLDAGSGRGRFAASASGCETGKYCAYSNIAYSGKKLTYSACPATQTAFSALGSVRSIANERSSGTVRAYGGSTLKATLAPGAGVASISGVTKITCTR